VEDTEEEETNIPITETEVNSPDVDGEDDTGSGAEHEETVRADSYTPSEADSVESFTLKVECFLANEGSHVLIHLFRIAKRPSTKLIRSVFEYGNPHSTKRIDQFSALLKAISILHLVEVLVQSYF
jgi:hypothetical protein